MTPKLILGNSLYYLCYLNFISPAPSLIAKAYAAEVISNYNVYHLRFSELT